jgi:hypothetical protein
MRAIIVEVSAGMMFPNRDKIQDTNFVAADGLKSISIQPKMRDQLHVFHTIPVNIQILI